MDVSGLRDLRSASDVWVDMYEVPIHRQIPRGQSREKPEFELLYVQGLTT